MVNATTVSPLLSTEPAVVELPDKIAFVTPSARKISTIVSTSLSTKLPKCNELPDTYSSLYGAAELPRLYVPAVVGTRFPVTVELIVTTPLAIIAIWSRLTFLSIIKVII